MKFVNNILMFSCAAMMLQLISCGSGTKTCQVDITVSGFEDTTEVYLLNKTGEFVFDTLKSMPMVDGKLRFAVDKEPLDMVYTLGFKGARSLIEFIAEQGTVTITGDKDKLFFSKIYGTPENDKRERHTIFIKDVSSRRDEMMRTTKPEDRREIFGTFDEEIINYEDSLLKADSKSIFSIHRIYSRMMMRDYNQLDAYLAKIAPERLSHPYCVALKARADVLRTVAVGAMAPDFTAKTVEGEDFTLSSSRGQYVLLDFWASWCVPCRGENVHTKGLHEKYGDKGLRVISFSLDSKEEQWKEAIAADGLVWTNISDLVGGKKSPVATLYGIDGIPAIWLIAPDGKIIAEGVRGEKLSQLCAEIFEN